MKTPSLSLLHTQPPCDIYTLTYVRARATMCAIGIVSYFSLRIYNLVVPASTLAAVCMHQVRQLLVSHSVFIVESVCNIYTLTLVHDAFVIITIIIIVTITVIIMYDVVTFAEAHCAPPITHRRHRSGIPAHRMPDWTTTIFVRITNEIIFTNPYSVFGTGSCPRWPMMSVQCCCSGRCAAVAIKWKKKMIFVIVYLLTRRLNYYCFTTVFQANL